jgi:hypothetical protein
MSWLFHQDLESLIKLGVFVGTALFHTYSLWKTKRDVDNLGAAIKTKKAIGEGRVSEETSRPVQDS